MALFDNLQTARIEAAIAAVETRSAAEIVVVSVPRSDRYLEVRMAYAAACALSVAAITHALAPWLAVAGLLWLELGAFLLVFGVLGLSGPLRVFAPGARLQECTERRAHEEFLANNVFATRDRTGVLILLSELERRVVMLGDVGILARVQTSGFQAHVDHIVTAIRSGRAAEGVCEVIGKLGETLASELPVQPDDQNELPNTVKQTAS